MALPYSCVFTFGRVAEKRAKYSEYSCHELNLFVYFKDRPFFDTVVKPYISCKRTQTFVDHWLLGHDLTAYLAFHQLEKLNSAELALLCGRVHGAAAALAATLKDRTEVCMSRGTAAALRCCRVTHAFHRAVVVDACVVVTCWGCYLLWLLLAVVVTCWSVTCWGCYLLGLLLAVVVTCWSVTCWALDSDNSARLDMMSEAKAADPFMAPMVPMMARSSVGMARAAPRMMMAMAACPPPACAAPAMMCGTVVGALLASGARTLPDPSACHLLRARPPLLDESSLPSALDAHSSPARASSRPHQGVI